MAELLRDVNSGGASSSKTSKRFGLFHSLKRKTWKVYIFLTVFLVRKKFTFPCIHGGRERGRNTGLSRAQPSA